MFTKALSNNPRTVANRKAKENWSSLQVEFGKTDNAFRVNKFRLLKAFRCSKRYQEMNSEKHRDEELNIIDELDGMRAKPSRTNFGEISRERKIDVFLGSKDYQDMENQQRKEAEDKFVDELDGI